MPILEETLTPPCCKHLAFKNKLTMCYEININVHHNGHSFQLRQKNFTVEWFSMLGHKLIEQPSYVQFDIIDWIRLCIFMLLYLTYQLKCIISVISNINHVDHVVYLKKFSSIMHFTAFLSIWMYRFGREQILGYKFVLDLTDQSSWRKELFQWRRSNGKGNFHNGWWNRNATVGNGPSSRIGDIDFNKR